MSHRNLLFLTKCLLPFSLFEPLDAEERRIMQEHPVTEWMVAGIQMAFAEKPFR